MSTIGHASQSIPVEDYLKGELCSEIRHEYLGGMVCAMAGASEDHNVIAANLLGTLYAQLRGRRCQPFGSDMKVRVETLGDTYFYYPDAIIACDPADSGHGWRERPSVLFEIISEETRRLDEREKRFAYHQIPGLIAYIRLEQACPEAFGERHAAGEWKAERIDGLAGEVVLKELEVCLPLGQLYERLDFKS